MYGSQRSAFLTALLNPLNLAMLALIAAAGLCAAWWLAPVGLVLWLVMFIIIYRDPAMTLNNIVEARDGLSQRFQPRFDRIEKTQISLFNALSTGNASQNSALQPVQEAVNKLIEQSYQLCKRMSALENHISITRANRNPQDEMTQVQQKLNATTDPNIKKDLEETRQTLQSQIANLDSISSLLERFDAQLTTLSSSLDGVLTSTIRLQALGKESIRREMPGILEILHQQATQLDEFGGQASAPLPPAS
jgi:chromosome segregation ATPase